METMTVDLGKEETRIRVVHVNQPKNSAAGSQYIEFQKNGRSVKTGKVAAHRTAVNFINSMRQQVKDVGNDDLLDSARRTLCELMDSQDVSDRLRYECAKLVMDAVLAHEGKRKLTAGAAIVVNNGEPMLPKELTDAKGAEEADEAMRSFGRPVVDANGDAADSTPALPGR
jgi:hypothetical protein